MIREVMRITKDWGRKTMKRKKGIILILILFITITMTACGGGYNTTNYIGQTLDNQMGRILNIGEFRGSRMDQWEFRAASAIDVDITVEEGRMHFIFSDPEGNVVFEQEVEEGMTFRERFEGEFPQGTYQLDLASRKARNVALEIRSILE